MIFDLRAEKNREAELIEENKKLKDEIERMTKRMEALLRMIEKLEKKKD